MNLSKSKKTLVIVILVFVLIIMGGVIFFLVKTNSQAKKSPAINEDKKFMLMVIYNFPKWKECRFYNSHTNKGFKISLDHPSLKGVELKDKSCYLIEGTEKFSLTPICNQTEIGISDKITITSL
jgi:hypothetical protein